VRPHAQMTKVCRMAVLAALLSSVAWCGNSAPLTHNTYAYFSVTDQTGASFIAQFRVTSNGKLQPLKPPKVAAGNNLISLTVSPDGKYVFALDNGLGAADTFLRFSVNSNGTLASNPVTSAGPVGFAYPLTLTPNGKFAMVALGNTVLSYSISASGEFTMVSAITAGNNACTVAIDPTGQFAYVGNFQDKTISEYRIASNGDLTSIGLVSTAPNEMYTLGFAPEGFLYSAGCCQLEGMTEYSVESSLGTITNSIPLPFGHLPWSFDFNPTGTYA
jgi:6-phosphogluconolactonase (cycloisomerase 2 family)